MNQKKPSFRQQVNDELAADGGPLSVAELARRLFSDLPEEAAKRRVRNAVDSDNSDVVRVGRATYDLLVHRLEGAHFRYRVSPCEYMAGLLYVAQDLSCVFRGFKRSESESSGFTVCDDEGREIEAKMIMRSGPWPPHVTRPISLYRKYHMLAGLDPFYAKHQLTPDDDVIITVESVHPPRYRLSVEKPGSRNEEGIRADDDDLVETCHCILKYTRQAPAGFLTQRAVGLHDFRQRPIPHLPMLLLPKDPRFIYFEECYHLREYLLTRPYYEEGMERAEMQVLLRGAGAIEETAEDRVTLAQQMILQIMPFSVLPQERVECILDEVLEGQKEALEADIRRTQFLRSLCFDRMRMLRGLWPDESDPASPEDWLRQIGVHGL